MVELPREENRRLFQDLVGFLQVTDFGAETLDLFQFLTARARLLTGINPGLSTHRRNVSGPTPSFGAKALQAEKTDG
jgi:hypothetical protein